MIYSFKCTSCGVIEDLHAKMGDLEFIKNSAHCNDCNAPAIMVMMPSRLVFARSPFPKGYSEHISPDGAKVRDKKEAMAIAEENGLVSVYCENRC